MFLTKEQIETLTGYKHRAKQCEQLRRQGVPFRVNARGEPIVATSAIDGAGAQPAQTKPAWQPAALHH
jgi:hypothetical protein